MTQQAFYEAVSHKLRAGQADDAIVDLQAWLANHVGDEIGMSLLGSALLRAGRRDEALKTFRKAVELHDDSFAAHGDLGFALADACDNNAAIDAFERAVEINANFYPGWVFLSRLHHSAGDLRGARQAMLQSERCDPFREHFRQSQQAMSDGRLADAEQVCRKLLKQQPGYPPAAYTLAHLASKVGAFEEASRILEQALSFYPADVHLYSALVVAFEEAGDYEAAREAARKLTELDPGIATTWLILGRVLGHCGDYEECLTTYDKAMTLTGSKVAELGNTELLRGHILKILGRYDEGIAAYRASANMVEGNGAAWWGLADMKTFHFTDDDVATMRDIAVDDSVKPEQRTQAAFALGKAFEDRHEFDVSFDWYAKGNALRTNVDFDVETNRKGIESIKAAYTPDTLAVQANPQADGPTPIFILGMPRAGSTLIEQILASHSEIEGTMELANMPNLVRRIMIDGGKRKLGYPESISSFSPDELAAYGQTFLEETAMYRTDKPYFIDKLPTNFDKIGLIHKILPQAVIIDARRHPMDCGFSCFKQHFAGGHLFSYDLANIGAYYNDYLKLMDYWNEVLPGKVFLAQYERVVDDTENAVRALLAHCGVDYEEACLRFFENKRPVRTFFNDTATTEIYTKGVGYWRNFASHLAPLEDAFGEETLRRFEGLIP
jgi:tetratricopeptide (TPR) repeat protein